MTVSNHTSVIAVLPVADHAQAVTWYQTWIGRGPDVEPTEGVAEWQMAENAWIQVSADPDAAGHTTVVVGVTDIEAQRTAFANVELALGEIADYGFIKTAQAVDPAGNKVLFVQEVAPG
jgi:hypothetical protein